MIELDTATVQKPLQKDTNIGKFKPKLTVSHNSVNKVKRLTAKGYSITKTAKESGVSMGTVRKIIRDPMQKESIETIKARLADKAAIIAENCLDEINTEDIKKATLVQKATVFGITTDKYNDLTEEKEQNTDNLSLINALKGAELLEFVKTGSTVKIGIVIEPRGNKTDTTPPIGVSDDKIQDVV